MNASVPSQKRPPNVPGATRQPWQPPFMSGVAYTSISCSRTALERRPVSGNARKRPSQPRDYLKVQCGIVSGLSDTQALAINVTDHQIDLSKLVRHKPILKPVLEPSCSC